MFRASFLGYTWAVYVPTDAPYVPSPNYQASYPLMVPEWEVWLRNNLEKCDYRPYTRQDDATTKFTLAASQPQVRVTRQMILFYRKDHAAMFHLLWNCV